MLRNLPDVSKSTIDIELVGSDLPSAEAQAASQAALSGTFHGECCLGMVAPHTHSVEVQGTSQAHLSPRELRLI